MLLKVCPVLAILAICLPAAALGQLARPPDYLLALSCCALFSFLKLHFSDPTPELKPPAEFNNCQTCGVPKPPLVHHCKACGRCRYRMDHHSYWADNCVAHGNIKLYVCTLLWLLLLSLATPVAALMAAHRLSPKKNHYYPKQLAFLILTFLAAVSAVSLIRLLIDQYSGLKSNQTVLESHKHVRGPQLGLKGVWQRWLGNAWLLLIPTQARLPANQVPLEWQ